MRRHKSAPKVMVPPVSYLSGPMVPPASAPRPFMTPTMRRKQASARGLSPIRSATPTAASSGARAGAGAGAGAATRKPDDRRGGGGGGGQTSAYLTYQRNNVEDDGDSSDPDSARSETAEERAARKQRLKELRCVACHRCISPIEQGLGRFCVMSDYGHIERLASFNDLKQTRVPEAAPADGEVVNEIPALQLLQLLPKRMAASHLVISSLVTKMKELEGMLEDVQKLRKEALKRQFGVDSETRRLMQGLADDFPSEPTVKQMWRAVHNTVGLYDARMKRRTAGIRPELAPFCNPYCNLHGE